MCCFLTVLFFLGPRFAGIVWWIWQPFRWVGESQLAAFNSWIWPVLGLIFLPWTTLMFVIVAPGGITGFLQWSFLILGFIGDVVSYMGGGFGNRERFGFGGKNA